VRAKSNGEDIGKMPKVIRTDVFNLLGLICVKAQANQTEDNIAFGHA
jgi:hypothetical protein